MINILDYCQDLGPVIRIVRAVVDLFRFGIPILLIIFGMVDLGKAVIAGKEDEMKKAQGTLIRRVIYAVAVFLVVNIVLLVMEIVSGNMDDNNKVAGNNDEDSWWSCWNKNQSNTN